MHTFLNSQACRWMYMRFRLIYKKLVQHSLFLDPLELKISEIIVYRYGAMYIICINHGMMQGWYVYIWSKNTEVAWQSMELVQNLHLIKVNLLHFWRIQVMLKNIIKEIENELRQKSVLAYHINRWVKPTKQNHCCKTNIFHLSIFFSLY